MSTINVAPSARIYVLISPQSSQAIIIRTGPTKHNLTVGWNLKSDKFTQGQWLKGKIYIHKCDISPDGKHWVYFAYKQQPYTVVAKVPFLKAILYFPDNDTWGGGGHFHSNKDLTLSVPRTELQKNSSNIFHINETPIEYSPMDGFSFFSAYLKKNNWNCIIRKRWDEQSVFKKTINNDWELAMINKPFDCERSDGGRKYFAYTLEHIPSHSIIATDDWDWADYDMLNDRVIWAEFGKIMSGKLHVSKTNAYLADIKCLLDMNDMVFEPLTAPY